VQFEGLAEPLWFGSDAQDAHRFVLGQLGWMLRGLDSHQRDQALGDLHTTVASHDIGAGVFYRSATWLIRATRR
jgi:hypothetical protein